MSAVEIAGRLTTRQRVLLVVLLSTAAIVYALPVGRRPIGVADEARQALLAEDTLRHGLRLPARVRDEPDLQKPPLFFWSVALVAAPAGHVSDRNATPAFWPSSSSPPVRVSSCAAMRFART